DARRHPARVRKPRARPSDAHRQAAARADPAADPSPAQDQREARRSHDRLRKWGATRGPPMSLLARAPDVHDRGNTRRRLLEVLDSGDAGHASDDVADPRARLEGLVDARVLAIPSEHRELPEDPRERTVALLSRRIGQPG